MKLPGILQPGTITNLVSSAKYIEGSMFSVPSENDFELLKEQIANNEVTLVDGVTVYIAESHIQYRYNLETNSWDDATPVNYDYLQSNYLSKFTSTAIIDPRDKSKTVEFEGDVTKFNVPAFYSGDISNQYTLVNKKYVDNILNNQVTYTTRVDLINNILTFKNSELLDEKYSAVLSGWKSDCVLLHLKLYNLGYKNFTIRVKLHNKNLFSPARVANNFVGEIYSPNWSRGGWTFRGDWWGWGSWNLNGVEGNCGSVFGLENWDNEYTNGCGDMDADITIKAEYKTMNQYVFHVDGVYTSNVSKYAGKQINVHMFSNQVSVSDDVYLGLGGDTCSIEINSIDVQEGILLDFTRSDRADSTEISAININGKSYELASKNYIDTAIKNFLPTFSYDENTGITTVGLNEENKGGLVIKSDLTLPQYLSVTDSTLYISKDSNRLNLDFQGTFPSITSTSLLVGTSINYLLFGKDFTNISINGEIRRIPDFPKDTQEYVLKHKNGLLTWDAFTGGATSIQYINKSQLPAIGESEVLYVVLDEGSIYYWDSSNNKYVAVQEPVTAKQGYTIDGGDSSSDI